MESLLSSLGINERDVQYLKDEEISEMTEDFSLRIQLRKLRDSFKNVRQSNKEEEEEEDGRIINSKNKRSGMKVLAIQTQPSDEDIPEDVIEMIPSSPVLQIKDQIHQKQRRKQRTRLNQVHPAPSSSTSPSPNHHNDQQWKDGDSIETSKRNLIYPIFWCCGGMFVAVITFFLGTITSVFTGGIGLLFYLGTVGGLGMMVVGLVVCISDFYKN